MPNVQDDHAYDKLLGGQNGFGDDEGQVGRVILLLAVMCCYGGLHEKLHDDHVTATHGK